MGENDETAAIGDLLECVREAREARDRYRSMLEKIGRRVNGWMADQISDEQLSMVQLQIDVWAGQQEKKIQDLQDKVDSLLKAVERRKAVRRSRRRGRP